MSRPKGSKNKVPRTAEIEEKGNAEFNIANAIPSETIGVIAESTYTDEDRALDLELERLAAETPVADISDRDLQPAVKKEIMHNELLCDHVEGYRPASTVNEIMDQVHQAKMHDCDSIYATPQLVKYYVRSGFEQTKKAGFFMFHDIKVYLEGSYEDAQIRLNKTVLDAIETKKAL